MNIYIKFKNLRTKGKITVNREFSTFFGNAMAEKKGFVVYGYHLNEKFAIEVGENLAQEHIDDLIIKMYDGKRPDFHTLNSKREWSLRSFLRKNLPFDYAIILHDGGPGPKEIMEIENPPCILFMYSSKREISHDLRKKLKDYFLEKRKPENPILWYFRANFRDMSKTYDKIDIEYLPSLISMREGLDFLKGLIDILKNE